MASACAKVFHAVRNVLCAAHKTLCAACKVTYFPSQAESKPFYLQSRVALARCDAARARWLAHLIEHILAIARLTGFFILFLLVGFAITTEQLILRVVTEP